jgi:lipoprotein-anchoring transpeptidase ErfK/SrfK
MPIMQSVSPPEIVSSRNYSWNILGRTGLSLISTGEIMTFHIASALKSAAVTAGTVLWLGTAAAAPLPPLFPTGAAPSSAPSSLMRDQAPPDENGLTGLPRDLRRQTVNYPTKAAAGSVVVDIAQTFLYYILGDGTAIRYGIGVGREGFTWSGSQAVTRKAEWPDWTPPQEMIARQPYLPRWMAGGEGNPLGARAIYLGSTVYRIHGTNMPETIGQKVSSGCIRMLNADVIDLYSRVDVGTKIIVLPNYNNVAAFAASPQAPVHPGL